MNFLPGSRETEELEGKTYCGFKGFTNLLVLKYLFRAFVSPSREISYSFDLSLTLQEIGSISEDIV